MLPRDSGQWTTATAAATTAGHDAGGGWDDSFVLGLAAEAGAAALVAHTVRLALHGQVSQLVWNNGFVCVLAQCWNDSIEEGKRK